MAVVVLLSVSSTARADALSAERLYVGQERPVWVEVAPPNWIRGEERLELVLLAHDGTELRDRVTVDRGRVRVDEAMPEIWRLRRAIWLQLLADGRPVGTPLVVEPLLSRLVPIAEEAMSPGGYPYTRIVGWFDEHRPPDDAERDRATSAEAVDADGVGSETGREIEEAADKEADADVAGDAVGSSDGSGVPGTVVDPFGESPWLANDGDGGIGRLQSGVRIYPDRDVILETSMGGLRIVLRPDMAPNTAWNFRQLAGGGFYEGVIFHRIVPYDREGRPFVIQAGDPTGGGSGGPGYWLPLERSGLAHDFGVVSMARDVPPDSTGSQFFICLSRAGTARLDGNYTAFAEVVLGRETILSIAEVELADAAAGRPVDPPVIEGVTQVSAPPRIPGVGRPDRRVQREAPGEASERKPR
jgi:peptidyl-prolyl cis-trans isomerase B (cyclophilin B)